MNIKITQPYGHEPEILKRLAKFYIPTSDLHIDVKERVIEGSFRKATEEENKITLNNEFMLATMLPHYYDKSPHIMIRADERGEICEFYFLQPR